MRRNRFRELLNAGQPTLGTHLLSSWPTLVELVGQTGLYDYISVSMDRLVSCRSNTVGWAEPMKASDG